MKERYTSSRYPSITVWCSDDLIGEMLKILLSIGIIKSSTYKSLSGEKSVFRVGDSLYGNRLEIFLEKAYWVPVS